MQPPGRLEEQAAVRRDRRRGRRARGRAPTDRRPAGACRGAADRAAAGRRAGRGCRVARAIATTLASEIWPASSTNSTSTDSAIFGEPTARTCRRRGSRGPSSSALATSPASLAADDPSSSERAGRRRRCWTVADRDALLVGGLEDRLRRLPMTLWLVAGDADPLAGGEQGRRSSGRRCTSCPSPVGPGSRATVVERERQPSSGLEVRLVRSRERLTRRTGRRAAAGRAGGRGSRRYGPSPSMPWSATHSPRSDSALLVRRGPDPVERDDRARVRRARRPTREVDGLRRGVDRDELADVPVERRIVRVAPASWPGRRPSPRPRS